MPHVHSAEALSRRRARAIALGFARPSLPRWSHNVSRRLHTVGKSLAFHEKHCNLVGRTVHNASVASALAKPLIAPEEYRAARSAHRAAGLAKHANWVGDAHDIVWHSDPWASSLPHSGTSPPSGASPLRDDLGVGSSSRYIASLESLIQVQNNTIMVLSSELESWRHRGSARDGDQAMARLAGILGDALDSRSSKLLADFTFDIDKKFHELRTMVHSSAHGSDAHSLLVGPHDAELTQEEVVHVPLVFSQENHLADNKQNIGALATSATGPKPPEVNLSDANFKALEEILVASCKASAEQIAAHLRDSERRPLSAQT